MVSEVSIANRALTKLGADRILMLTDESQTARTINSMYVDVRDAEIRRYTWKFSIKRTSLSALVTPPAWGYKYQYPLPSDYIGLVQVNEFYSRPRDRKAAWSIEGDSILTDFDAPLKLRYKARIENADLYDPLFVEVLACKLAMEACETLTQSGSKYDAAAQGYKFALSEAARQDALENPPEEFPWGSFLDARGAD